MAVLADYLDLRLAVADHVGNREIADVLPRLVRQAEGRLNQTLRLRWQIASAQLAFMAGLAPLPADYLEMLNVWAAPAQPMRAGTLADVAGPCSQWDAFAIDGANVRIYGLDGVTRACDYYAALPTLTAGPTASNWLLERYPDVYLYAVALAAATHLRDAELVQATQPLLAAAMEAMASDDERARWSQAVVRPRMVTP